MTDKVRASRDGDRFHYYWAARRALKLLEPGTDLHAVAIEGVPEDERGAGDEVVDVAEYRGAANAADCTSFRHIQLKHSTYRTDAPITAAELDTTLRKFAARYRAMPASEQAKVTYTFVCNRRLNDKVRTALTELGTGTSDASMTHPSTVKTLRGSMNFGANRTAETQFCQRFVVEDDTTGLQGTEQLLQQDLTEYLPGLGNRSGMALLLEHVSRRALTLEPDPVMVKADVLAAFATTEHDLFPAPNRIEHLDNPIRTANVESTAKAIVSDPHRKMLLTATGGIGKSVLTTLLPSALPAKSVTLVYDCFAGGEYRRGTRLRHNHRTALTQLANELAGHGLCPPLVPSEADSPQYLTAFLRRVNRSATQLAADAPHALLTIVIDAADNAAMEAKARGHDTFVTDLLRESWPANVRLVMLCRPERVPLLNPPAQGISTHTLIGFTKGETLHHLRATFPDATDDQGASFQLLSSGNPRVQAMALEHADTVEEAIETIQVAARQPGDALDVMLATQVADLVDQGHLTADELIVLCEALVALPPPIPIDVVAHLTGLSRDLITSFAHSLGRGLHTQNDTLQFRDEPTENWFRTTHEPKPARRHDIVRTITPLASQSVYVASSLPQLLHDAGMLPELVDLALSDTALPSGLTDLQAQEVARSRARYALNAMLRSGRNKEAALVAVKAGTLTSGHTRRLQLYRSNPDLLARFLDPDSIEELCSSRDLSTHWPGSNLHVEAAILSHVPQLRDVALARFTSAANNMAALTRLPKTDGRRRHDFDHSDVADLALASFNTQGPSGAVTFINRWQPKSFTRLVARGLTVRLADAGRDQDVNGLIVAAEGNKHIVRAAAATLFDYNITPTEPSLEQLLALLTKRTKPFTNRHGEPTTDLRAVTWTLLHALRAQRLDTADALRLLNIHLDEHLPDSPDMGLDGNAGLSLLTAHALRAHLRGTDLTSDVVASPRMAQRLRDEPLAGQRRDHAAQRFSQNVVPSLAWVRIWVTAVVDGPTEAVEAQLGALFDADLQPVRHNPPFEFLNTIAALGTRALGIVDDTALATRFTTWHASADEPLTRSRLTVTRTAGRIPHLRTFALDVVARGIRAARSEHADGSSRIEAFTDLARAVFAADPHEADALFADAVDEANLIGDDLYDRWNALLNTCTALRTGRERNRAEQLFVLAENLHRHASVHIHQLAGQLRSMHEPTFLAAASQARDRRTLDLDRMLEGAIYRGTARRDTPALLALSSFTRHADWRRALTRLDTAQQQQAEAVMTLFTRHGAESNESSDDRPESPTTIPPEDAPASDRWSEVDFTTEGGWEQALTDTAWLSAERELLPGVALTRHHEQRPAVLRALARCDAATLHDVLGLAKAAAQQPRTPALSRALSALADSTATRFARDLCTRAHTDEDLAVLAKATGVNQTQIVQTALRALGGRAHDLGHRDFFALAAHIATTLNATDAGEIFDALTPMFDELAPTPEEPGAAPAATPQAAAPPIVGAPDDVATCTAGLIWAALGDISGRVRWQGAHAVLLLRRLGCEAELASLASFADGTHPPDPFIDTRLPFYQQHARMWLLLALSRAVRESGAHQLRPFHSWLVHVVLDTRHAVNQTLAQDTLQHLHSLQVELGPRSADALLADLTPATERMTYGDHLDRVHRSEPRGKVDGDVDPDRFFFDFEKYWCRPLGDVFGRTGRDIARRASVAASGMPENASFRDDADPRHDIDIYDSNSTWADQSQWPAQERLGFYLGVHSLLTAAADLAVDHVAFHDEQSPTDSYREWLAGFLPTRQDGRWLDDRRDPRPTPAPAMSAPEGVDWPWTVTRAHFDTAVAKDQEWVTVWASDHDVDGERRQDVFVESALAPTDTAHALLLTLQHWAHAPSPPGYLPTTDDSDRDRRGKAPFDLVPWIDNSWRERGLDQLDERARGVRFPPPRPGRAIIEQFALTTDDDERVWYQNGTPVLRSQVWGTSNSDINDAGARLQAHRGFLNRVLSELERTVVIQARIDRDFDYSSYRRRKDLDDEFTYLPSSGRTYLLDGDGQWHED